MRNILKVFVISFFFLASCSSDEDNSSNISDSNLSGTVSGDSFTAIGGKAFDSGDEVSINITNVAADCDSFISDYDLYVSTDVPLEEGTYTNANVVFHKEGETPFNYFGGTVIIETITDTSITLKIKAESGSDDTVEGTFTVDYCI